MTGEADIYNADGQFRPSQTVPNIQGMNRKLNLGPKERSRIRTSFYFMIRNYSVKASSVQNVTFHPSVFGSTSDHEYCHVSGQTPYNFKIH